MPLANPFSITYGSRTVGGSTSYQLLGPYVIEKNYEALRLVFDVLVSAGSLASVQALSESLESDFRKRLTAGDRLVIDLGGTSWTYNVGRDVLNVTASITKTGNRDTDKGYSRAYTVTIAAGLPADHDAGLRNIEVLVEYHASRQRTVTMRGTYTATTGGDAVSRYQSAFDSEALAYLDAIDSAATWELADETYSLDRERSGTQPASHLCNFTRQYTELLADQSQNGRDDPQIRDHRIVFTDLSQHPGDSRESVYRLRRVVGSYDCAIDIEETTDLQATFNDVVYDHVVRLFTDNFEPQVFAVEEQRVSYDETSKRLSVSLQFLYQASGGEALVEVSQSVAYREARTIDYTPVHGADEFAYEADVGWAVLERVWNRTAIVVGQETPKTRIYQPPTAGAAGPFSDTIGGITGPDSRDPTQIQANGWNVVASTSQVTPQWIGDPEGDQQIAVHVLTETVVERYHRKPAARTTTPMGRRSGPTTPR